MSSADLRLLKQSLLNYTQKRKKWLLLALALGFSGYGARKVYQLPSFVKNRKKLSKIFGALISFAELVSDSAETIGVVSNDLKQFIQSDSDQIPNSLKQISKIARSDEFSQSVTGITRALALGIYQVYKSDPDSSRSGPSFTDQVLDKLFSKPGSGFASVVVGSFAKNLVMAAYSCGNNLNFDPRWIDVICDDKSKELIGDCVRVFVSTAIDVYLQKTMHINTYNEIFAGLTNPDHEMQVRDLMSSVCNGAVETLIKTSHRVLTDSDPNPNPNSNSLTKWRGSMKKSGFDGNVESGWVNKMSNTLTVPRNRRLVLDLTGRVTFESVKSFLEFMVERLTARLKKKVDYVNEEVVNRGIDTLRYMNVKSSAVVSLCLSLCLHILGSPWILLPA